MKQGINAIEIVGLNKFFGGREVLKDINFTIEKGDIFDLIFSRIISNIVTVDAIFIGPTFLKSIHP